MSSRTKKQTVSPPALVERLTQFTVVSQEVAMKLSRGRANSDDPQAWDDMIARYHADFHAMNSSATVNLSTHPTTPQEQADYAATVDHYLRVYGADSNVSG